MDFDLGTIFAAVNFAIANPIVIGILIGAFIGWNFPQPAYAKWVQAKVVGFFRKTFAKKEEQ